RRQRPRSELRSGGAGLSKLNPEAGCKEIDPHPKLKNLRRRGVGRAKRLRETESRVRAEPDWDAKEDPPASRNAEERGLRAAAADPARGRRRAQRETEPRSSRGAPGGRENQALRAGDRASGAG
ncbi:hypothetical protein HispidOSU_007319, partial [Sigmodon hispidus]